MKVRALLVLLPFTALACAATPVDEEGTESSQEALSRSPVVAPTPAPHPTVIAPPTRPPVVVPAFPPVPAIYCPSVDPNSTLVDMSNEPGWATKNAELAANGCTGVHNWYTGYADSWLGANIALCTDTPAVRAKYPNPHMIGACDATIPRAPAGQVYVDLGDFVGPGCQSGCSHRNDGGW